MSPSDLELKAIQVSNYLMSEQAVRSSTEEVLNYKTVYELCEAVGIYVGDWSKVKTHMLSRGDHICYKPGKGHYLGFEGEEVANVVYQYKIAKGWVSRISKYREAIKSANPAARAWITRRFKDFDVDNTKDEVENAKVA